MYSVTVDQDHTNAIADDCVVQLASHSGAVSVLGRRLSTTLTVDADDIGKACAWAAKFVTGIVGGRTIGVEALTIDEADRRLAEPAFPELVGIAEAAEYLGVSRQRASQLQTRQGFPAPVASLRSGPVWRKGDLSRFAETWSRQAGRPKRTVKAAVAANLNGLAATAKDRTTPRS